MAFWPRISSKTLPVFLWVCALTVLVAFATVLVSCGGSGSVMSTGGMATVHVSNQRPSELQIPEWRL